MKKNDSPTFFEKLLIKTGRRYPLIILLVTQFVNTLLTILLIALPAQENAEFSKFQGNNLLIFGSAALLARNLIMLAIFHYSNNALLARISLPNQVKQAAKVTKQDERAWEQATSASKNFLYSQILGLIFIFFIPTSVFGYLKLHVTLEQLAYLGFATLAAGITNFLIESLLLDQFFEPIIQALIPEHFEAQLAGMKGMRLRLKLALAFIGLVLIALLLITPSAYQQLKHTALENSQTTHFVQEALPKIITAGIGALVVGTFLSIQLTSYFSGQFQKMINMFSDIEAGDLSRRSKVSSPDEFGTLNIYLNHMIERIQVLYSTLEDQVIERTANLNQTNDLLQVELTERKRMEEQLKHSALHDPLTDLPNRILFMDRLSHVMKRTKRNKDYSFAVMFMDLDSFKVVNDSLGHTVGDLVLIECGKRLAGSVRGGDTIARLGGDEFVILLDDVKDPSDYIQVANRIQRSLTLPFDLDGQKVFLSVSMGIVLSDERYEKPEEILRDADIAMYRSKDLGRGRYEIFNPGMLESAISRLALETDLWKAVENKEFIVHYQPILDTITLRIIGFEALVRWLHPKLGLLQPANFIPTAEEIGLIVPIGYWVLEEACMQVSKWLKQFPSDPPLTINVNLSNKQFDQPDLIQKVSEILKKSKLDANCLRLEITERLVMKGFESTAAKIAQLKDLGVKVHIDDFGTGFSSLGYLHKLAIDTLKIDRPFISRLENSDNGLKIVQTMLSMAHDLGIKVIAEGVETNEQFALLKKMKCEFAQGFLFSQPVESMEAAAQLGRSVMEGFEKKAVQQGGTFN